MTEYQCQTCGVITIVENDEKWFEMLTKHHNAHVGTKWGPSYEIRRFAYYYPTCVRVGCGERGTHEVRSEYFGASFCDKHWNEEQSPKRRRLLNNLLRV